MAADRAARIAGLRKLADVLEDNPDLPLPHPFSHGSVDFYLQDGREDMQALARALPCSWVKHYWDGRGTAFFDLRGKLGGLSIHLSAHRDAVCTRVVTGQREVTETVKDPEALAKVPEVTVTRVVDDVEWKCEPLMKPALADDAPLEVAS